jgi:elongation factor 1-beta
MHKQFNLLYKNFNRFNPTKADSSVFDALGKAPAAQYVNIGRWYRHIASYNKQERDAWTGTAVPQVSGGNTTCQKAPAAAADDDDVDLFGSDEEDDAAAEKLKEERLKAYNEKKSKKPALIAKSSIILDVKPVS